MIFSYRALDFDLCRGIARSRKIQCGLFWVASVKFRGSGWPTYKFNIPSLFLAYFWPSPTFNYTEVTSRTAQLVGRIFRQMMAVWDQQLHETRRAFETFFHRFTGLLKDFLNKTPFKIENPPQGLKNSPIWIHRQIPPYSYPRTIPIPLIPTYLFECFLSSYLLWVFLSLSGLLSRPNKLIMQDNSVLAHFLPFSRDLSLFCSLGAVNFKALDTDLRFFFSFSVWKR